MSFKSGFVAIIGRPNVGKSSLLNYLTKVDFSIVTPKAQTTRNNIRGILTESDFQAIFIDTPGFHKSENELGEVMNSFVEDAYSGVDLILYLIDATKKIDETDYLMLDGLKKVSTKAYLIINKVDLVKDKIELDKTVNEYLSFYPFAKGLSISIKEDFNLHLLKEMIKESLPEGPKYYDDDEVTDSSIRFIVSEVIRKHALESLKEEVPYSIAVVVEEYKENKNPVEIRAEIIVERESQKKIIIGKGGEMIKLIGKKSRLEINRLLGIKSYLEIFVKVDKDWRNNKHKLKEFGYYLEK